MNTEDILDEIQYLKKKTLLLERLLNTKQDESFMTTKSDVVVLNVPENESKKTYKKRSIC